MWINFFDLYDIELYDIAKSFYIIKVHTKIKCEMDFMKISKKKLKITFISLAFGL